MLALFIEIFFLFSWGWSEGLWGGLFLAFHPITHRFPPWVCVLTVASHVGSANKQWGLWADPIGPWKQSLREQRGGFVQGELSGQEVRRSRVRSAGVSLLIPQGALEGAQHPRVSQPHLEVRAHQERVNCPVEVKEAPPSHEHLGMPLPSPCEEWGMPGYSAHCGLLRAVLISHWGAAVPLG